MCISIFFSLLTIFSISFSNSQPAVIPPSNYLSIDPSITDSNIKPKPHHIVFIPSEDIPSPSSNPYLLIHLSDFQVDPNESLQYLSTVSTSGFYSIGLAYQSEINIQEFCQGPEESQCNYDGLIELITGRDFNNLIETNSYDCIIYRTRALLLYLKSTRPTENWGQFLNGTDMIWDRVIVSGLKQGADLSVVLAKLQHVSRVIQYSGVQDYKQDVQWLTRKYGDSWKTPIESFYGFMHVQDTACPAIQNNWISLLMNDWGSLVDVGELVFSNVEFPFTSRMCTHIGARILGKEAESVLLDSSSPINHNNSYTYIPVWKSLLGSKIPSPPISPDQVFTTDFLECQCQLNPLIGLIIYIAVTLIVLFTCAIAIKRHHSTRGNKTYTQVVDVEIFSSEEDE